MKSRDDRPRGPRNQKPQRFQRDRKPQRFEREERSPRFPREERPQRFGEDRRPPRDNRPGRDERPRREDRSQRFPREDRAPRFPRADRPQRFRQEERPTGEEQAARSERPHLSENELRYHGKNACLALWKARPNDIIRVYVLRELAEEFTELLEFCAENRKAYHLVDERDLEKLTDSVHHQGVCIVARAKRFLREDQFFRELGGGRTLVLYLDGVGNPHNLGAILRTAAHFGLRYLCVPSESVSRLSPAIFRTAEGGAEYVSVVRVEDTEKFLDRLQGGGFHLYAFDPGAASQSIFETRLNEKSAFVFGAEVEGLSGLVRTMVETKLLIPGTGAVESLNVSVAAALAMGEFQKQGLQRSVRIVKNKT